MSDDGLPAPQRRRAVLVILLGIAVSVLDGTIMNLALPSIARDLQASAAQSVWVVNAYQIAILALLLPLAAWATCSATGACTWVAWRCSCWRRRWPCWRPTWAR